MATGAPMGTIMVINMVTDPVLILAQWFSPSYPIGAFAYSYGIEQAIADAQVHDAASLSKWIEGVLQHGSGHNDAVFLAAAYRSDDVAQIDAQARAFVASRERLMETDLQGAAFAKITASLTGHDLDGLTYPVAAGRAARLCDLPLNLTLQMFLHAFVSTLVSVGIRAIPIGQTDGHSIIATLAPVCVDVARGAAAGDLSDLTSTAFFSDVAAMRHETLTSRVFRT